MRLPLVPLVRAAVPYLACCVVLGLAAAACVIVQAHLLAHAIVTATLPVSLIAVVAARAALAWCHETVAARAATEVRTALRTALLARAARGVDRPAGEVTALVTRGVAALDPYVARYLPQLVTAVLVPLGVTAALLTADWTTALIVAATLPLIPLFGALVGAAAAARTSRQWQVLALLSGHFADVVAGLATLKVFGRARAQAAEIARVSAEHRRASMRTLRLAFCSALVLELAATLSVALVAVSVGLRLLSGHLTFETALFALILAPEAYLPLRQAGAHYHAAQEGLAAAEDIRTLLGTPPAPVARPLPGPVRAEELVVGHAGRAVAGPVSFTLEPGARVALTGPSGCGKSTVLAALLGFAVPLSGRLFLPVADDWTAWRRQIAWVPQRPAFVTGTVADNLALAVPGASPGAVREAACVVGLDALLTADATALSAGQRQRVALARAALRCRLLDTTLLLLDEPTAHLDPAAELDLCDILRDLGRGRTTLLVTHRRTPLALADRIVALPAATREPVPA